MLKFDEKKLTNDINGALALRAKIEPIVDTFHKEGFDQIFFLGIGGTWASALQVVAYLTQNSTIPAAAENAAEYVTGGNRRLTDRSLVVFSTVTGTTEELVAALDKAKKAGARILSFVDNPEALLAKQAEHLITYPANEQLKFFMVAMRLMYLAGEFPEYDRYFAEMEKNLAAAIVDVEKRADAFGEEFAKMHHDDDMHYFVGAGTCWGHTYSYAMCFWEEQHWRRSKSIHAAEFFHGTFEIIDRDTNVTVFMGEDAQRPLTERVANFLPRICARGTVIDSKDYPLPGISPEFRGTVSHMVMRAVINRIDAHMEKINCHPLEIRRYYRQLDY